MGTKGILWVTPLEDQQDVEERAEVGWSFSEVVDTRRWSLQRMHRGIVVFGQSVEFVATFRRGRSVATRKRRITLGHIQRITSLPLTTLFAEMPSRDARNLERLLPSGGVVPDHAWAETVAAIIRLRPESEVLSLPASGLPTADQSSVGLMTLGEERDAVLLSLDIAGLRRDIEGIPIRPAAHFLDGLDYTLREDALVIHDARQMPGFDWAQEFPGTAVQFQDARSDRTVTIMNINRTPLETTTGVDLLYYRHELDAFVLVQYKRLKLEGTRWVFRPDSDPNFAKELARMEGLSLPWEAPDTARAFRLSASPFYIKLCRPQYADLAPDELAKGMYVPLDYLRLLESTGRLLGPRGGRVIGYHNAERWLNNTLFVDLVRDAWIGTAGKASAALGEIVAGSLRVGHSAVVAVERGELLRPAAI